ncbi:MAG: hypothetical protein U5L04_00015 [Trueperaceae bacterium]|nr:hypothetical protein [Trueperaceae bacterium]
MVEGQQVSTSSRLRLTLTSSRWLLVVSTLLAGLAVSTAAWWAVGNIAERAIDARFARATAGVATRVEGRLDATESTVQAVRGLLDASEETTAAELSRFLGALSDGRSPTERFPGLTALALVNADGTIDLAAPGDSQTLALVADALVRPRAAAALEQATDQARPITVSLPTGEDRLALAVARYSRPGSRRPERDHAACVDRPWSGGLSHWSTSTTCWPTSSSSWARTRSR